MKDRHNPNNDVQAAIEYKDVKCEDCGMQYGLSDWIDTTLPNAQWNILSPDTGILCANCIIKRASKLDGIITSRMILVTANNFEEVKALKLENLQL